MKSFLPRLIGKTAVLIATLCAWQGDAAPPVNDTCAGAIIISNAFPYLTPIVDVADATTNGDPVLPPIGDCLSGPASRSVWYTFTPAVTTNYTISTCTDTTTTLPDTVMAIYLAGGPCASFSLFECADDACGIRAAIETVLEAGTTYYIVVWNSGNLVISGNTLVQLRVSPPVIATNDTCVGAEEIPPAGPFPHLTAFADTRLAGRVGDPANPACGAAFDRSVWYRFTPAASGAYNFSLCTDTGTTIYDTVLAIYSAASCAGPFTRVACNDDACEFQSALTTNLTAGTTYYILAWDPDHTVGESLIQLRVAGTVPQIASGRRLLNGLYELRFNANFAQRYTVQAANDLLGTWNSIGTITNGAAVFLDTNALTFSRRFYRLRTP